MRLRFFNKIPSIILLIFNSAQLGKQSRTAVRIPANRLRFNAFGATLRTSAGRKILAGEAVRAGIRREDAPDETRRRGKRGAAPARPCEIRGLNNPL